ncbi:MAG: site-specific integrase [Desulfobulbaceae bacterium]|nr:site-specific integrase [Desulfobulbaceae bacterium]
MAAIKYPIKKHQGVFGYDSATRRFNGKPDTCLYITFKLDGKKTTEKVGWLSEGYTPQLAAELRAKRIREGRHQGEVKTSRDIRAEQQKRNRPLKEVKEHYFNSVKGQAIKGRQTDVRRWDLYLTTIENKGVRELSQLDIEKIKRTMKEKELAPATVDHALRLLRRVVNHGAEHGLCPSLGFKIQFPKVNNIKTEFLTPEEATRLMETLNTWPSQDIARMVKIAMFSGLRRGELFKLKREHLDFRHGLITIAGPKGGTDATVPMSPPVRELLEQQLSFLEDEQARRAKRYRNTARQAPAWEDQGYVFPGILGGQRVECGAIDRIKKAADLPKHFRPFHGLRHHYAVLLASSGEFNLDQIGQLLTHKSSDVTRRYAHFLPEAQQRAAGRAAEIITAHLDTVNTDEEQIAVNQNGRR